MSLNETFEKLLIQVKTAASNHFTIKHKNLVFPKHT